MLLIFHVNAKHLPLLQTLLSSSSGPLESLSSSCRCKWLCWLKWWWFSPRLWCKWCKWLLLLFAADALRSRGFSGDGDLPPFSTCSRLRWSAAPTLAAPPPPKMSVIMKRDRDGSTAIDPRCIGTVIVKPLAAATPFADNNSAVLVIVDDFGLAPDECHWSTILMKFHKNGSLNRTTQPFGSIEIDWLLPAKSIYAQFWETHTCDAKNSSIFRDCFLRNNYHADNNSNSIKTLA